MMTYAAANIVPILALSFVFFAALNYIHSTTEGAADLKCPCIAHTTFGGRLQSEVQVCVIFLLYQLQTDVFALLGYAVQEVQECDYAPRSVLRSVSRARPKRSVDDFAGLLGTVRHSSSLFRF